MLGISARESDHGQDPLSLLKGLGSHVTRATERHTGVYFGYLESFIPVSRGSGRSCGLAAEPLGPQYPQTCVLCTKCEDVGAELQEGCGAVGLLYLRSHTGWSFRVLVSEAESHQWSCRTLEL